MNPHVHCEFAVMICRMGSLDVMGDPLRQGVLIVGRLLMQGSKGFGIIFEGLSEIYMLLFSYQI